MDGKTPSLAAMFLQFFPQQMWRQKTGFVIKTTSHILQQQATGSFQVQVAGAYFHALLQVFCDIQGPSCFASLYSTSRQLRFAADQCYFLCPYFCQVVISDFTAACGPLTCLASVPIKCPKPNCPLCNNPGTTDSKNLLLKHFTSP